MSATIRVALVGFGLSAQVFHAPFIQAEPSMALSVVCSSQTERVRDTYPDAEVVATFEDVIARSDVDLVVITTPNHLHFAQTKAALLSGKHVLLEKPSVTKVEEIETLIALAKQQQRLFCVFQNRRFDADFVHLKNFIIDQSLGELKHLESRFDRFRPQVQQRWRELPGEGTGIFWDLGPHIFDQVLALLGAPQWLHASIDTLRKGGQTHDWFELELGYPGKRVRLGSTPFEAGEMRRFNARFDGGSWQCFGLDPQEACLRQGVMPTDSRFPAAGGEQRSVVYEAVNDDPNQIESMSPALPNSDYREFYRQLAQAIQEQAPLPVSHEEAAMLVYGMELALKSAELGQRLDWDYGYPDGQ